MASTVFDDAFVDGWYFGRGLTKAIPEYYRNPKRTPSEDCLRGLVEYLYEHWLSAGHAGLRTVLYCNLIVIDKWLRSRTDEELNTACNGEESEAQAAWANAPHGTDELLSGIFEHVG